MAEIVRMPKLSDTMEEGVVAEWHKKVGDEVNSGDVLAEIETDKATMEFESFQDGVLLHIGVEKGDAAPVDSILAILGEEGEDISDLLEGEQGSRETEDGRPKTEDGRPRTEEGEEDGKPKEGVEEGDDENAEDGNRKTEEGEDEGDDEAAEEEKQKMEKAESEESEDESDEDEDEDRKEKKAEGKSGDRVKASPLARKLARDKGIEISEVKGSGDGGRIVKKDIENYKPKAKKAVAESSGKESYREEPVSQMRKTIAKRLGESKFTAPHFYLTIEMDMENAMASRKAINKAIEPAKISINDFVVKAAAAALKKHPKVNASWKGDKIRYNEHVHIGVAVAVEEGLLVPVVRFADSKSMKTINDEVRDLAEKARSKKLQPQDWEGNTFTISNLGMYGIEEFTAIINPPDSAILAIGTIVEKPVVKEGQIVVGHTMKVTMSCDHRIVDGAVGSEFLQTFKKYMENPVMILAE